MKKKILDIVLISGIIILFIGASITPIIGASVYNNKYIINNPIEKLDRNNWWNQDWNYCKKITINHNLVAGNLQNFPILVYDASSDYINHAQSNGNDFAFVSADNTTQYNHEIETYNSTTGTLIAWVNVTSISSSQDTIIYLYYGNPSCTNQQNINGVWDSDFKMIQHLKEKTGLHYDSTVNHNDGTPSVTIQGSAIGKIDGADTFNYVNKDYVDCGNKASLNITTAITIEAWIYYTIASGSNYPRITDKYPSPSIYIRQTGNYLAWYGEIGGSSYDFAFTNTIISQNTWSHIVVTYVNNASHAIKTYVNGQLKDTITTYSGALSTTTVHLAIGNRMSDKLRGYNGTIDEVRISNIVRSSSWLKLHITQ